MSEYYQNLHLPNTAGIFIWHLFCVTAILFICERIWRSFRKDPRLVEFARQLPGPHTWPLIGNGLDFLNNMDGRMEMLKNYEAKYGSTYRLWFGQHLVVGVADVKDLEVIFSSSKLLNKPAFMDPAREFWGDNLFTSRSPLWKKSRKELQPLFTKNILMEKVPIIDSIIQKYMKKIEDRTNGPEFDIGKVFPMMAFDTLLEVVFNSSSVKYTEEEFTYLDELMHEADCIFFEKMFKPWLKNSILDYFMYKTFRSHFKRHSTTFCQKIMKNQKTEGIASGFHNIGESGMKPTFIQLLYKIRDDLGIGDEYISAETLNTIAAGTMTTSTTLSFCILMLAMHPDVQNKLREELSAHFENSDRAADVADLDYLPYLDQVLKETERLFTLVPATFRNVEEDTKIGSHVFPAGTAILVPVSAIHSNSEYYKNPEKFDPEHFNADSVRTRPRLAFIPFSTGARNCIGKVLAELELKLSLVALIRLFEFSTMTKMEDIDLLPGVSATNRNGYWVRVRRRGGKYN